MKSWGDGAYSKCFLLYFCDQIIFHNAILSLEDLCSSDFTFHCLYNFRSELLTIADCQTHEFTIVQFKLIASLMHSLRNTVLLFPHWQDFIVHIIGSCLDSFLSVNQQLDVGGTVAKDKQDFLKFADAFLAARTTITTSATLKTGTKVALENVGTIAFAFSVHHRSNDVLQALSAADVTTFTNGKPESEQCKQIMKYNETVEESLFHIQQQKEDVGIFNALGAVSKDVFSKWIVVMKEAGQSLLQKCQTLVLENEPESIKNRPEGGWVGDDDKELSNRLSSMQAVVEKLEVFQPKELSEHIRLTELKTWIQEARLAAEFGLTEAERSLKVELTDLMNVARVHFPAMNQKQLMHASYDVILEEVIPKKGLAEAAAKLCERIGDRKCLESFDSNFKDEVSEIVDYMRVMLSSQSAVAVIKGNDPEKAATFEEKRLKPRGCSMSHLPDSVRNKLGQLAKK